MACSQVFRWAWVALRLPQNTPLSLPPLPQPRIDPLPQNSVIRSLPHLQPNHHHCRQQRTADCHSPTRPTKPSRTIRQHDKHTTPSQLQRPCHAKDIAEQEEVTNHKRHNQPQPPRHKPQPHRPHASQHNHHPIHHRHPKPRLKSRLSHWTNRLKLYVHPNFNSARPH
jgi:hypothetical protein